MSDRLTKEELRHDWLMDHSLSGWLWIRDHLAVVLGGIAVVGLGIALVIGTSHRSGAKSRDMEEAFAHASQEYNMGSFQTAAVAFDNFVGRFGNSALAGEAMLRGASAHLFTGRTADAQKLFQQYLDSHGNEDPFLQRAARHGLAACLENQGDYAGALAIYTEMAGQAKNDAERRYHQKAAARCLTMQGKLTEAATLYGEIAKPDEKGISPDPTATRALLELQAKQYLAGDRSKPFAVTGS